MVSFDSVDIFHQTPPMANAVVYKTDDKVIAKVYRPEFDRWDIIAKGDAGIDDASVIQTTLNTIPNGGCLKILDGIYSIYTKITIPSNIKIEGNGWKTILKRTFNGNMINQSTGENIIIKDIAFDGGGFSNILHQWKTGCYKIIYKNVKLTNSGQTTNAWDWAVTFYGANYCVFEGIIEGFTTGIKISNGSTGCYVNAIVRNSSYIDVASDAISIDGYSSHNIVKGIIENVAYRGMFLKGYHNIVDVTIKRTGDFGLWFDDGEYNQIKATIEEAGLNTPNTGGGCGIHQGRYNKFDITTKNNYYDGVILGAHITDIPVGTPAYVENNILNVTALNNNQGQGTRAGLKLYTGTKTDAYIRYNIIKIGALGDNQSTPTQYSGIIISGSGIMENNVFEGGSIFGNTNSAMSIEGNNNIFKDISITGSVIINSGTHKFIRCKGYITENYGTASITGDGSTTTFTIPHGLVSTPNYVNVIPKGNSPKPDSIDWDATNITLTFNKAPAAGTYYYAWEAKI